MLHLHRSKKGREISIEFKERDALLTPTLKSALVVAALLHLFPLLCIRPAEQPKEAGSLRFITVSAEISPEESFLGGEILLFGHQPLPFHSEPPDSNLMEFYPIFLEL